MLIHVLKYGKKHKVLCFTGATCIAVRVDMSCFKIQVFDNGHGVQKDDLETVAER